MAFDLYTEYRYTGRKSPNATIVPIEENGEDIVMLSKSAYVVKDSMKRDRLMELVENDPTDTTVDVSLIEKKKHDPELYDHMVQYLEENDCHVSSTDWNAHIKIIEKELEET